MDNDINNILSSVGITPGTTEENNQQPQRTIVTDPALIQQHLSQPGTVYAAIQEEHHEAPNMEVPAEAPHQISDEEFNDILTDVGYTPDSPTEQLTSIVEEEHDSSSFQEAEEVLEVPEPAQTNTVPDVPVEVPQNEDLIPENSPTLTMDDSTIRFSGALWYEAIKKTRIILAGLGGIGSWCGLLLARLAPASIVLYDDDTIDTTNMGGQLYTRDDIGKKKASSMVNLIGKYTSISSVYGINERFDNTKEAGDIMICGFDNMIARTMFFNSWLNHLHKVPEQDRSKCVFIDGRLSIDTLQVFTIRGNDAHSIITYKRDYLFSDYEADAHICSLKQTSYMANMIASLMVNSFTNFIANTLNPDLPYDNPFFIEYDSQNMLFKTIE